MASVSRDARKLGGAIVDAAKDIGGSPKGFIDGLSGKSKPLTQSFGSKVAGGIGDAIMWPLKKSGKVAIWMVEQPIAYGLKAVRYGVNGIGGAYKKAPLLMVPLTLVGGVMAYNSHERRKVEARTEADKQRQFAELEAQILNPQSQQPQMQQPQAVATTYQVTPEEARLLQQRMKGGQGSPVTGHADTVVAARETAAQKPVTASL